MCFVDINKAFDKIPKKVMERAIRKRSLGEVLEKAVMIFCQSAKTKIKVGSQFSEKV